MTCHQVHCVTKLAFKCMFNCMHACLSIACSIDLKVICGKLWRGDFQAPHHSLGEGSETCMLSSGAGRVRSPISLLLASFVSQAKQQACPKVY
jgi:hypothetical protein